MSAKGRAAMGYAMLYPEGKQGKKKSPVTGDVPHQRLSEARTVFRFSPELAESVFVGVTPLDEAVSPGPMEF